MASRPRIAIVGGSGYIGSALANHLSTHYDVRILDSRAPSVNGPALEYFNCDIRSYEEVKKALEDVDLVIHTAIVQIPVINEQKRLGYEVNIIGTHNVCEAVEASRRARGMILAGTWHTIGERELRGVINEEFGYRPDKVEDRARLYVLSKMAQASIVRYHDEMSTKIFGILRLGTVLGPGMPPQTAASIFIEKGLKGEALTPYRSSMHRPMLYVDIEDVCRVFESYAERILYGTWSKSGNSLSDTVNVYYPEPLAIIELANMIRETVSNCTGRARVPSITIVDTGQEPLFSEDDKTLLHLDISKLTTSLGVTALRNPAESIARLVRLALERPVS